MTVAALIHYLSQLPPDAESMVKEAGMFVALTLDKERDLAYFQRLNDQARIDKALKALRQELRTLRGENR